MSGANGRSHQGMSGANASPAGRSHQRRWVSGKFVIWVTVTLCSAVVAFSAGQQEPSKGEIIMNNACGACHDMRPIQTQAMDLDGWTKLVESMIEKGAQVKKEDVPVLAEYLTQ